MNKVNESHVQGNGADLAQEQTAEQSHTVAPARKPGTAKRTAAKSAGRTPEARAFEKTLRSAELSDEQWEAIAPIIPGKRARRGRPRAGARRTLDGILYILMTGKPWEEVPRQYGSPATCWRRMQEWMADGTWERIWQAYVGTLDDTGRSAWADALLAGHFVPSKRGRRNRSEESRAQRAAGRPREAA